jgi:hypothetical protein
MVTDHAKTPSHNSTKSDLTGGHLLSFLVGGILPSLAYCSVLIKARPI